MSNIKSNLAEEIFFFRDLNFNRLVQSLMWLGREFHREEEALSGPVPSPV